MHKKQLAILSLIIIFAIGIPVTLLIFSKQQEIRSHAEKSTTLYFVPSSSDSIPIQTQVGNAIPLDVTVNPGTNLVSFIKLEILYDSTKFEMAGKNPFQSNTTAFPQIIEGPILSPGKILITLSIGTDPSKAIRQITSVGILNLKALNSTTDESTDKSTTLVTYGTNTQVLALGSNASATENVLSNTQPAIISIDRMPKPTCMPKPPCLNTTPICLISEPLGGWCPISTPTPTPTPTIPIIGKCPNSPTDSIIIIDKSGSMNERINSSPTTKTSSAKDAAKKFVDIIAADTRNKTGLISFSTTATLNSPLTNNYGSVKNLINSLTPNGYTCHECAINKVKQEIAANSKTDIKKVAILLTDGEANWIEGGTRQVSQSIAEQKALDAVKNTFNTDHVVFYTIGLGKDVNTNFLKQIADMTGGKYYFSPTTNDLQGIYQEITQVITRGSINGFVFNDANNNKIYDQNENKLPDWTINLFSSLSPTPQSFTSDKTGTYNIENLCDGTYTLKEILKAGWTQTIPTNPNEYLVNITNGSAVTGKNFGNYFQITPTPTNRPTPTPPVVETTLLLNGLLDGIGSRGDNSNPDGSLSNKNPLHPTRNSKVNIFDAANQLVANATGTIEYSSTSGSFTGKVLLTSLASGNYTIKVATDNHLVRLLQGIQNIKSGQNNQLPDAIFIAGDVISDNQLNIQDYNIILGCYSDLAPATNCKDIQSKNSADLNDDGAVNQFDYNLFLREIATQPGQ